MLFWLTIEAVNDIPHGNTINFYHRSLDILAYKSPRKGFLFVICNLLELFSQNRKRAELWSPWSPGIALYKLSFLVSVLIHPFTSV